MNVVLSNTRVAMSKYFVLTLPFLLDIIYFDIDNTYFTVGHQIYKQIKGIPMGSNLSPALAYLICEYYERRIPKIIPPSRLGRLFGARYMDDILLIRLLPRPMNMMRKLMDDDMTLITDTQKRNAIYHKDLLIKPDNDPRGALCLGSLIYVHPVTGLLEIRYKNKNEDTLTRNQTQSTLRFQHFHSFSPLIQKKGTISGEIVRIHRLTSNTHDKIQQYKLLQTELCTLSYPKRIVKQLLIRRWKLTKDNRFKTIAASLE